MKWENWRRSEKVEDYRDPNKPVATEDDLSEFYNSINEMIKITNSDIAKDLGNPEDDVKKEPVIGNRT